MICFALFTFVVELITSPFGVKTGDIFVADVLMSFCRCPTGIKSFNFKGPPNPTDKCPLQKLTTRQLFGN